MTWTYDPSLLSTSVPMQVRFLIGDTDPDDELLQDEEIEYIVSIERGTYYAAARCCQTICAVFARKATTIVGSLRVIAEAKFTQYTALHDDLMNQASIGDAAPVATAISKSSKRANEQDTDLVHPAFTRRMDRNPNAGPVDPVVSLAPWSTWP